MSIWESKALLMDDDELGMGASSATILQKDTSRRSRFKSFLWLMIISLVTNAIIIITMVSIMEHRERSMGGRNAVWRAFNNYSPIVQERDLSLSMRQMKGSFMDEDGDIFRQLPSPEVDAAWENLTEHGVAYVSAEDLLRMGSDPQVVAKFGPEFGLGEDAYGVETDILHKIHCLNMIRKDLNFDYYWRTLYPDGVPSERHRLHTNHCLYVLLQSLMCDANTDLIPQVWMKDYPWPTPDFNIQRKCGNLEAVRDWEREHRIERDQARLMRKLPGQKTMPMSSELQRVFEVEQGWDDRHGV